MQEGERKEATFEERLHPLALRAVHAYGIKQPSSVQLPLVDALRRGESCVVKSRSGTGKSTGAVIAFVDELARWDSECEAARVFQLCWQFRRSECELRVLIRDVVGVISRAVFDRRRRPRML
jgi:hypothetical protein